MSKGITRLPSQTNNSKVPKVEYIAPDNKVPKVPVQIEGGGSAPVLESITITENGNTTPPEGVDGYNDITVLVPQTTLESITITENGTTTAPSGKAYNEITVDVPPVEPDTKVVSFYDFSDVAYDKARSIVGDAPQNTSLVFGAPYNASVTGGEMVFNNTGYGYFHPAYYLNELKNYEIEIEFGIVSNTQGGWELCGFKIYGSNFSVWLNYENNVLTAFNSSGNFNIPNRTLADFSNKTIKFLVTHKISPTTNDTLTEISLLFEGETTPIKLGDVDNKLPYYPYIGSLSNNAIREINIKSFKITESKWTLE